MSGKDPKYSIVAPVFNESETLPEFYRRIYAVVQELDSAAELLLIDDGSTDNSLELMQELQSQGSFVRIISFSRNFGHQVAITAGIDYAKGDAVIVIDSDLQDSPEEIKNLYKKAKEGYDIVLAKRLNRKDSFIKKSTSFVFSKIASYMSGFEIDYRTSNYGIYSKRVIENYKSLPESKLFFPFIVQWLGFPKSGIEVEHSERLHDKSSYRISKLLNLAFDSILYSSTKPLLTTIKIGLFISALSFIYSGYIIFKKFAYGIPVLGWASTTASIWFLSGLVITVIGVVGAYVGKVFEETKKRPMYIIEDIYKD